MLGCIGHRILELWLTDRVTWFRLWCFFMWENFDENRSLLLLFHENGFDMFCRNGSDDVHFGGSTL